jgi:mRNA interferase YafQ
MRIPSYTGQFKRDVKLAQKRGKDMGKLKSIIELLLNNQALPRELNDHPLKVIGSPIGIFTSNRIGS